MRLRNVRPPLPAELLSQLEDIGVKSDADLLFGYGDAVDIYCKLTSEGITLQDVKTAIAQVTLHCSCTPNTGSKELALHEEKHKKRIQVDLMSGVPELDGLVSGFGQFSVLEISGDSGSGKTALARQIVFRHLSREPSMTSLWIDTTGGFSIDNISPNILESSDDRDLADVLERLQVSVAFGLTAVHEALDTLRSAYTGNLARPLRCIVIDNVTQLFRPMLSVVSSQGHALMSGFMRELRAMAEIHGLTIFVLNSTSTVKPFNPQTVFADNTRKPALGPSFTYMTDATLWLSRREGHEDENSNSNWSVHSAEVLRSKNTRSNAWCLFQIRDGVLVPYGSDT